MNNVKYSILVNTCDKFEDCWDPFFKLWSIYWKECKADVYLNTEYKDYCYPGLKIIPIKGCAGKSICGHHATWSQCFRWALEIIDTDVILYMQEDYFLNGVVDNQKVEHYVKYMEEHQDVPCIQLTTAGILNGDVADVGEHLNFGIKEHFSYVSCQASLWRKEILFELIRDYESAWNFEWYGSRRAKYKGYEFLTVDHLWLQDNHQIVPYVVTGVIGGKWYKPVVDLFEKHDIRVDFNKRGFFSKKKHRSIIDRFLFKLRFVKFRSELELLMMKLFQRHYEC